VIYHLYISLMHRMDTWSLRFDEQAGNPVNIGDSEELLELFRKISPELENEEGMVRLLNNCTRRKLQSYAKALATHYLCDTVFQPLEKAPETFDFARMRGQFAELETTMFSCGRFSRLISPCQQYRRTYADSTTALEYLSHSNFCDWRSLTATLVHGIEKKIPKKRETHFAEPPIFYPRPRTPHA